MTLHQVLTFIKEKLTTKYDNREISWMIRDIFDYLKGYSAVDLVMRRDDELSDFIISKVEAIVQRLLNDEPLQYILGFAHFGGHKFIVTPATLIPRPETQELVDIIINENKQSDLTILDIGTGSGCIAISLARALKFPIVNAVDISANALEVASKNAEILRVKIAFRQEDALSMPQENARYNIIVSNPPYIIDDEKSQMERNVLDYEPAGALFVPNNDPLRFYRAIAQFAQTALTNDGRLYFEINPLFATELRDMLKKSGFAEIEIIKDLQGRNRFAKAKIIR